jgi:hypothetical protein
MDAAGRLTLLRDQKGLALVYVALLMVGFCAFLGLAIDVGYMYLTRGQLQNAADAAALAGAAVMGPAALDQQAARQAAVDFAKANKATSQEVKISSDDSNTLSSGNDITIGNWNPALPLRYSVDRMPKNAVQVRARRTGEADAGGASIGGPVELFFAQVVSPIWSQMGTSAAAIAQRAPKAGFYFMMGRNTCNATGEQIVSPKLGNMAWSSLLDPSTSASEVLDNFICPATKVPDQEVCGRSIYTTNGTVNTIFNGVETDFYDPEYDRANKTYANGSVATWTVIVPVSAVADPSTQPAPQAVWGYAKIVITRACGNGNGTPCSRSNKSPGRTCKDQGDEIVISSIECVDCANSSTLIGARPSLVQ